MANKPKKLSGTRKSFLFGKWFPIMNKAQQEHCGLHVWCSGFLGLCWSRAGRWNSSLEANQGR